MRITNRVPLAIVALSTIWQAVGTVVIGDAMTERTSTLSSFIAFGSAALLCTLQAAFGGMLPRLLLRLREPRTFTLLLLMNVATAGVFVSFYVALAYLPATSVSVLEAGCAPIVVAVIVALHQRRRGSARTLVAPVAVLTLSTVIAWQVISREEAATTTLWFGVGLAVFAGASGACVVLLSGALSRAHLSPSEVNAARFHLAWVVSGVAYLLNGTAGALPTNIGSLAVVSVTLGAAPLIVLQYGLSRAQPVTSELIMSTLPALVFGAGALRSGYADPTTALLMAGLVVISVVYVLVEAQRERRAVPAATPTITSAAVRETAAAARTEGSP